MVECVRDLDHGSMISFSPRVTIIRQNSMRKQAAYVEAKHVLESTYGLGWEFLIIEELTILTFFKRKLQKSSITWNKLIATLFYHIISHNNLGKDHTFFYPQVSS